VSREETPIDPGARSAGPRVVFPPLTPNGGSQLPSGVVPGAPPATTSAAAGTFSNNEPRQVRTFSVRGDQATAGTPAAAPPPAPAPAPAGAKPSRAAAATSARPSTTNPNAANANGPLSLAPQAETPAAPEPVRVAATNPAQVVPAAPAPAPSGATSGYLVQVSSQRSEADAQASYKSLQSKYPSVLGSHAPLIKRADLGEKGTVYRAMVGPFGSNEEASQFCSSLKSAGGQCYIQRN
jgi:SPOR domain